MGIIELADRLYDFAIACDGSFTLEKGPFARVFIDEATQFAVVERRNGVADFAMDFTAAQLQEILDELERENPELYHTLLAIDELIPKDEAIITGEMIRNAKKNKAS